MCGGGEATRCRTSAAAKLMVNDFDFRVEWKREEGKFAYSHIIRVCGARIAVHEIRARS